MGLVALEVCKPYMHGSRWVGRAHRGTANDVACGYFFGVLSVSLTPCLARYRQRRMARIKASLFESKWKRLTLAQANESSGKAADKRAGTILISLKCSLMSSTS